MLKTPNASAKSKAKKTKANATAMSPTHSDIAEATDGLVSPLDSADHYDSDMIEEICGFNSFGHSATATGFDDELSLNDINSSSFTGKASWTDNAALVKVKRGFQWQVLCTTALAQKVLQDTYRVNRLRRVLQRHLLPQLLINRDNFKGSLVNKELCRAARNLRAHKDLKTAVPIGRFLGENHPFLLSLNSSILLNNCAESMDVERVAAGHVLARAGDKSQESLVFIVFGKVVYRDRSVKDAKPRVLQAGDHFGGIFNTSATFTGDFRCISDCILWRLSREAFDDAFLPLADSAMKQVYLEAFREHCIDYIPQSYPVPQCLSRVPIYRRLNRPLTRYMEDFEPCVLLRGETLFEEGDGPSYVYCMLEGSVRRRRKGFDNTFATGVCHLLTLNSFSHLNVKTGRFALLGDAPLILPSTHRYQCTVMSRYGLFFRVTRERFISALLDDPTLFVQLREKLTQQIRTGMRLDPMCLSFAPLLREFPESSLHAIALAAEPRVLRRSVPLCEPAENVSEIFLIVHGEIRDTRVFDKKPTRRLDTPPPVEDEDAEEERRRPGFKGGHGKSGKGPSLAGTMRSGGSAKSRAHKDEPQAAQEEEFDLFSPNVSLAQLSLVTPDEQSEFNPALPILQDKRFEVTVGGGWEGLLVDKWTSGWEGVCTVAAWALPTLKIRTEFNGLPKAQQSLILSVARLNQKEALGLQKVLNTRLPPMSSYLPPADRTKMKSEPPSSEASAPPKSRKGGRPELLSQSQPQNSDSSPSLLITFVENSAQQQSSSVRVQTPTKKKSSEKASPKKGRGKKKVTKEKNAEKTENTVTLPDVKPTVPLSLNVRRPRAAPTAPPPVDPFLLAVYNGEYKDGELALTNIVRDPPTPKKGEMKYCKDLFEETTSNERVSWPLLSHPEKRWFSAVPSYEPLPGTVTNRNIIVEPPMFSANTDLMSRKDKRYRDKLVAEADFFTSSMKSRLQMETMEAMLVEERPASERVNRDTDKEKLNHTQELPKRHAMVPSKRRA